MKKIHFIGIAGAGMSAVAVMLRQKGYTVTGSDEACYPPASTYLEKAGVEFTVGYQKENIPEGVDCIVIGKNAKLVKETNPEVAEAFSRSVTIYSLPELLNTLVQETENIVVVGSYGKSTVTSLIAWCMQEAGKEPSYFIGATPLGMSENAHTGNGNYFILEGDEYPSANWDEKSKFLYYKPHDVLFTSAEHDHINVFPTPEEYQKPFSELLTLIPEGGSIFVNANEENALTLAKASRKNIVSYGINNGTWQAKNITYGEVTSFTITKDGESVGDFSTTLLGEHNVRHIVGVTALLMTKGILEVKEIAKHVASFQGLHRRLDRKTSAQCSVQVYEGFGSSYEKARAAIDAMHLHFPQKRLIVVFEPHTFSWRNKATLHWYDTVFKDVDSVLVYKPAEQGKASHDQSTQQEIVDRIRESGTAVEPIQSKEDGLDLLEKAVQKEDVILLLTSGDLGGLIEGATNFVEKKFCS